VLSDPTIVRPAFQPIFDLARGRVCGFEALARFAVGPLHSPVEWLSAASERGLESAFEATLLEAGLRGRASLPGNCFLSVNISPDAMLSQEVRDVIDRAGRLDAVVIELTEREPVKDYAALGAVLAAVRERGGTIAVDDAGAGYASLQHIMSLRPEFIKLDRALVAGLDVDAAKLALAEAVGSFAARIDSWLVAEGIEHDGELDAVRSIGVPLGQGFGLARPAATMAEGPRTLALHLPPADATPDELSLVSALAHPRPLRESLLALAEQRLAAEPETKMLVLVDEFERPTGLLPRASGKRVRRTPMCVQMSERPDELARRAMTRPPQERFDPMVACDELGRYVGLLETDQLIRLLSRMINDRR
jgi:EAL domain-containing protein (putative c-di-GMP-specific phosphodiesterase class I)